MIKILQSFTFKLLVSCVLVAVLIYTIEWRDVWEHMRNADPLYLLFFVVFYICGLLISAYKWYILALYKDFQSPFSFYIKAYTVGAFLNNFFPSFIGGDAYRILALGKPSGRTAESSQVVVADRISGFLSILILGLLGAFIFLLRSDAALWIWLLWGGAFAATAIIFALLTNTGSDFVKRNLKVFPGAVEKFINGALAFREGDIALRTMLLSILFSFVGLALSNYMLFLALGIAVPIVSYLSIIFIISVLSAVPVSVGNIGVKEWAYISLFGVFGIAAPACVSVVLLSRILQALVSMTALPAYLIDKKKL